MSVKANIIIDQGTDFSSTITVTDDNGDITDLAGYTANGHIRKHYSSSTATVFDCAFGTPTTDGKLTISLPRTVTGNMEAGRYVYDVELTNTTSNTRIRLIEGIATVTPEVTRA